MKKVIILFLIASLLAGLVISHAHAQNNGQEEEAEVWVVRKGETLWGIANLNRGKTEVRKYISKIQKINDIGTTIYPGQELILP